MTENMTKNVRPPSRNGLRREKSSRNSSTLKWNDPTIKINSKKHSTTPSLDIKDYDPGFALRKIALLYEKDQNEAASHIINHISWSTLNQIYTKFPVDLFIEAIPRSLGVIDTLYSRFFLKDADNFPAQNLPLSPLVVQIVKLYVRKQSPHLPKIKDWDDHEKHMKNLLKIIGYVEGSSTLRMLKHRRQCLDRAVNGLGRHGLVEVEVSPADEEEIDKKLMGLSDGLHVELNRMTVNCKRALSKLSVLEKQGEFESFHSGEVQKYTTKQGTMKSQKSRSQQYASVVSSSSECNHQRIFELTSEDIQGRLYQNKVILNVLEPIMHYAQLPWLLTVLQERIERDKDLLLTFSQLRKEILSVTPNAKLAPALKQYAEAFTTVINLLRKYVTDDADDEYDREKITSEMDSKFSLLNFNLFEYNKLATSSGLSGSLSGSHEKKGGSVNHSLNDKPEMQEQALLRKENDRLRHELHKSQRAVERLRHRENDLLDRLTKAGENSMQKSKSFEKISPHGEKLSDLVDKYKNLYTDSRVHALDGIERALQSSGRNAEVMDIKNKLLFSVIVLAFRTAADTLDNLRMNIRELLCMSKANMKMSSLNKEMENTIENYLRSLGDGYDLSANCTMIFDQLCDALYDCPQLRSTQVLYNYVEDCVKVAWRLTIQSPPYIIEYDSSVFDPSRHDRFHTSNIQTTNIITYLWPSLIDKQAGRCISKGIVITDV